MRSDSGANSIFCQCMKVKSESEVAQSCLTLQPTRLLCPWDFPGKSTGLGCHRLLRLKTKDCLITCFSQELLYETSEKNFIDKSHIVFHIKALYYTYTHHITENGLP